MPEHPFRGYGLYALDERDRMCLPKDIVEFVKWLDFEVSQDCLAVPGRRGIAVLPPAALEEHRKIAARLAGWQPSFDDIGTARYDLARALTTAWPVTIQKNGRFTLPLGARELGLVPSGYKAEVGLLAFNGVFEVLSPEDLRAQIREPAGRWAELMRQGLADLRAEEEETNP